MLHLQPSSTFPGPTGRLGVASRSMILGEHDREHAPRERRVRWIVRSEFEGGIVIVDLEEDALAPKIEGAEVSLGAVVWGEIIPAAGGEEFGLGNDFTNRVSFACETGEACAGCGSEERRVGKRGVS